MPPSLAHSAHVALTWSTKKDKSVACEKSLVTNFVSVHVYARFNAVRVLTDNWYVQLHIKCRREISAKVFVSQMQLLLLHLSLYTDSCTNIWHYNLINMNIAMLVDKRYQCFEGMKGMQSQTSCIQSKLHRECHVFV